MRKEAEFRFYEELNDFLPLARRKVDFSCEFAGTPAVVDLVEAIGVPHTEVDLILVDGASVGFGHRLCGGERVAVYPVFELLDISPLNHLRPEPLRELRFVLDVHLGRLARYLRLLGFDVLYETDYEDAQIAAISCAEGRIVLTRDKGLLKRGAVQRGYWLRKTAPREQLAEVVQVLDLREKFKSFTRCMDCNGALEVVAKEAVIERLPPKIRKAYEEFGRCTRCDKVYWAGSHYDRMRELIATL